MPCHVRLASSGSSTWKLNESVPTTAIIASGIRRPGVRATCCNAERIWPRPRRASRGGVCSAAGSIRRSATIIATNDKALTRKHGPTPSRAITPPAIAGPRIRDVWTITEFSATAFTTFSGPTISITKLWRAGLSMAVTAPRTNTSA